MLVVRDQSTLTVQLTFTDTRGYFVSESSVYRLLKAHDLITSPAFIVVKAADEFKDKVKRVSNRSSESIARVTRRTSCGRPTSPI